MTAPELSVQELAKTFGDARRGTEVAALAGVDMAVGAGVVYRDRSRRSVCKEAETSWL